MKKLWELFFTFFKIGAFTFGGGYAMIPLIQREAAQKRGWISQEEILEVVAIAESTPGPIAINAATFVGWRVAGIPGSLAATLGVVLPSFTVILILRGVLRQFRQVAAVEYAFRGIRLGVLALIVKALWGMYQKSARDPLAWGIMLGVFVAVAVLDMAALPVLIACALVGLAVTNLRERRSA